MSNATYLRAYPGSKTKALNSALELNEVAALSIPAKQALIKLANRNGTTLRVVGDLTAVTSTTLATSSEFGYFDVKAGKWYEMEAAFQMTNGSAANGAKLSIVLTGTQTNMKGFGVSSVAVDNGADPTDATHTGISTNTILATSQDTTSPFYVFNKSTFKPINDGKLVIQLAERDTGSGTLVLKEGSYLHVRVLE